jgi:F0F1-type ATP synthase membrane subunit b/b'
MIHVASASMEAVVADTLDDATHQDLIESFIQRVGAST